MFKMLKKSFLFILLMTALTGVVYPFTVTAIGRIFFPYQSNGSIILKDGKAIGSQLIGQSFNDNPAYFWSRPSDTSDYSYNGQASSGSNLTPAGTELETVIAQRIADLKKYDPNNPAPVPADLVTASGSGLDPDISPAAAEYQIERVAKYRNIPVAVLEKLVVKYTRGRFLGIFGEPRVNVLELNLALDSLTN